MRSVTGAPMCSVGMPCVCLMLLLFLIEASTSGGISSEGSVLLDLKTTSTGGVVLDALPVLNGTNNRVLDTLPPGTVLL